MVVFIFIQILIEHSVANSGDPNQTPHPAASGLGFHWLPMSYKKDIRLKWVNISMLTPPSAAPLFTYYTSLQF